LATSTARSVGSIEGEWPEQQRRNIFYAPGVLVARLAVRARSEERRDANFLDLVQSPSDGDSLDVYAADDEALVEPSTLIDDVPGLALEGGRRLRRPRVRRRSASLDPVNLEAIRPGARSGRRCGWHGPTQMIRVPRRGWPAGRARVVGQRDRNLSTCPFVLLHSVS
jgi:hypothetical protein